MYFAENPLILVSVSFFVCHLSATNFPLGSCKVTLTCMFKPCSQEGKKDKNAFVKILKQSVQKETLGPGTDFSADFFKLDFKSKLRVNDGLHLDLGFQCFTDSSCQSAVRFGTCTTIRKKESQVLKDSVDHLCILQGK